jgi:hypothetical protein
MGVRGLVRSLTGGSPEERELKQWRDANRDRLVEAPPSPAAEPFVEGLRERGIVLGRFEDLFGSRELYDELETAARALWDHHRAEGGSGEDGKGYLASLLPRELDADSAFARIALHPRVLEVASGYLGMHGLLRAIELWLTWPTEGAATETQLWHRDGDDVMNVKFYVFFTDVTPAAGPFCYAPRTQPGGPNRTLPERDEKGRATDEQMRPIVPDDDWQLGTGPRGTVMFADTSGFHKQQKPTGDERLMLMVQYTSGTPHYPVAIELRGLDVSSLDESQRAAVSG